MLGLIDNLRKVGLSRTIKVIKIEKKNKIVLGVVGIILLILFFSYAYKNQKNISVLPLTTTSTDFNFNPSDYPFNPVGLIARPVWGGIECNKVEDMWYVESKGFSFSSQGHVDGLVCNNYDTTTVTCPPGTPEIYGVSCKYSVYGTCPNPDIKFPNLCTDKYYYYSINSGTPKTGSLKDVLMLSAGQSATIKAYCGNSNGNVAGWIKNPAYTITNPWIKLYIEPEGYIPRGWLPGSDGCKLISSNLKNRQPIDVNAYNTQTKEGKENNIDNLKDGDVIPFGVTKNFVVGWRLDPTIGTVRKYNNQDAICSPFDGIYSIKNIATNGGVTYYMQGSIIKSYESDSTLCCTNDDCPTSSGYVCENFKCTLTPTCKYGQCNEWQKGDVINEYCESKRGVYSFITETCGNDLCIQRDAKNVKCCRDSCYGDTYCDYDKGCVDVEPQKECPLGSCCTGAGDYESSGNKQNEYGCKVNNRKCCFDTNIPFVGACKTQCNVVAEICFDEQDNDLDGLIDCKDDDCKNSANCIIKECSGFFDWIRAKISDDKYCKPTAFQNERYPIYILITLGILIIGGAIGIKLYKDKKGGKK